MKKSISMFLVVLFIPMFLMSCGKNKTINGKEYKTIGIINILNEEKDPSIKYRIITGNVIWGVLLCESVIAPLYFFGFSMYEPIAKKEVGK